MLTDGIQTTGTNMSLYLKGRHNLITNQANIDIYGRISDEIREKLGSFGNVSISEMMKSKLSLPGERQVLPEGQPHDVQSTGEIPGDVGDSGNPDTKK